MGKCRAIDHVVIVGNCLSWKKWSWQKPTILSRCFVFTPGLKKAFVKRVNQEALVVQNCTRSRLISLFQKKILIRLIGRFQRKEKQPDREKRRSHGDGMEIKGASQHLLSWAHCICFFGFGRADDSCSILAAGHGPFGLWV
jgi:hypothetical protein